MTINLPRLKTFLLTLLALQILVEVPLAHYTILILKAFAGGWSPALKRDLPWILLSLTWEIGKYTVGLTTLLTLFTANFKITKREGAKK